MSVLSPPRSSSASQTGGINAPTATATAMEDGRRDASAAADHLEQRSSQPHPGERPDHAVAGAQVRQQPHHDDTSTPSDSGTCQIAKAAIAGTRRGCRNCCEANGLALSSA